MTLKNLLCVAGAIALMTSAAAAQGTGSSSTNSSGPVLSIDWLRDSSGNPVIDTTTGGLTYIVSVTPDTTTPTFDETPGASGPGPNGPGGSIGLELGLILRGGLSPDAEAISGLFPSADDGQVDVNVNTVDFGDPGLQDDTTANEGIAAGIIDFANPGNPIFGFETLNFDSTDPDTAFDKVVGIQISTVGDSSNTIDFSSIDDGTFENSDSVIFGGLGTTFISASSIGTGTGQAETFEILRLKTQRLDSNVASSLTPELIVVGSASGNAAIAAQSTDLSDAANPQSTAFAVPSFSDDDSFTVGDVNLDGSVDPTDLNLLLFSFGNAGTWANGNFNADATVNPTDLNLLLFAFGGSGTAPAIAAAVVPEPLSGTMACLTIAGVVTLRRRHRD